MKYILQCYSCGEYIDGAVRFKKRICFNCKKLQKKVNYLTKKEKLKIV